MAVWNVGEKNGFWKGGRSIASNGYVLIRVGKDHPLSDVRGYAYEHRIVASEKLGRMVAKDEIVHHINGVKTDNRPENLEVCLSNAEHRAKHRDEITEWVHSCIFHSPYERGQLAEMAGESPRRIGWALQRLRKRGAARLLSCGSWDGL